MNFDFKEEELIIKPYKNDESIYVRLQRGLFYNIRKYSGAFMMLLFVLIPWIPYKGEQAILLDVANQQFRIFAITFFPQDLTVLAALFMVGAFALFFFTTWLGRVWCGFMCPQTIWMFLYIWVEEKIEGNRNQRIRGDKQELDSAKFRKKTLKHAAWLLISFLTATTFMSYFIPVKTLYLELFTLEWSALVYFWVGFFTLCTYGNAGWLREKMCIYMCPYSRFQSAMFDKNTLLVAYDKARGENRGMRKRKDDHKAKGLGDCVDCNLCVEVCPVGIDIRNGLQYECISCAACIDACDQTMERFNYPKGLISFTSENALIGKKASIFRPKIAAYAMLTLTMFVLMGFFIATRTPIEASILRDRNVLYRTTFDGSIENSYQLKLTNKLQQTERFLLIIDGEEPITMSLTKPVTAEALEMVVVPFTLTAPPELLPEGVSSLNITITSLDSDQVNITKEVKFYAG
ncbi:cytochrome c oxidase accessory protein CcoG [Thalassotalea sp. M1531]|uniref:Cytochrome c oxidase accessory protein CcoG n=1 Tax=Thalassotalea algicola TaxID=2716224 RepID=A0A7Y0LCU1_9GAMM|nr:cytochrome c oxidase accessory protein CcoG [Thalassotalea algicola]NMP31814.1 cytochrome c oxidase accessory protein CcoG [Thalassotalea algicola]